MGNWERGGGGRAGPTETRGQEKPQEEVRFKSLQERREDDSGGRH